LGRSGGGQTTKIHPATDTHGRSLWVILTPGQAGDVPQAPAPLDGFRPAHVLADKAYDSNALRILIADISATAVIPCNLTRKRPIPYDFEIYKARNRIARCFNKLKHFRRIATRYDRRAIYSMAFIHLACAILWMR
jgi:transposase